LRFAEVNSVLENIPLKKVTTATTKINSAK